MTSLFNRIGVRMGALGFTVVLASSALACSDDGTDAGDGDGDTMSEEMGDGDGDMGDGDGDGALSYAADIQPIWDANCTAGCHMAGGLYPGLDLSGDSYANVVGVLSVQATNLQLIEANSSETSYLVNKLRGTHLEAGGNGGSMPSGANATPLPEATIATIEEWIDAGALP